jgi:DNA-binding HxlR family transcriptional regulator
MGENGHMRSQDQYCPVAEAAEALGDRWCLLLVREMLHGVTRFNEFERCLPGISRSVLAQRLRQLERDGVVERHLGPDARTVEYVLTEAGRGLDGVVQALGNWAAHWIVRDPRPDELNPDLLMLWISRHINTDQTPARRVVIEVAFTGRDRRYWLVLRGEEVSLCVRFPGYEPDLKMTADVAALYRVYRGRMSLADALRDNSVMIDGPPALVRQAPRWFAWSSFAPATRAGTAREAAEPRP